MSTGEFRATPDLSASTAQFQAFAAGESQQAGRRPGRAMGRGTARTTLLIVVAVLVLVAIGILIAAVG